MMKKNKLIAILLTLCMVIGLLPSNIAFVATPVMAYAAELPHNHCVCGASHDNVGGHTTEDSKTFTAWTSVTSLPDTAGSYYLTEDVTISSTWAPVDNTVLCLNGHSITASGSISVITVNTGVTFTLTDCQENQGRVTHSTDIKGSGVNNREGTFNMFGGCITGNTTGTGGGVNNNRGTFNMYDGSITGNTAESEYYNSGGGVYNVIGTFNMHGGSITGNVAGSGGGIYNSGIFYMYDGSICGNTVNGSGGGVYNNSTDGGRYNTYMYEGTISGNTAKISGGGVFNSGNFYMYDGAIICGNMAGRYGGGMSNWDSTGGNICMYGGSICGNTAASSGGGIFITIGTFKVSGNVNIFSNVLGGTLSNGVYTGGSTNNVYLDGKTINVIGALTGSGKIGVTASNPATVASGQGYTIIADDFAKFTSDKFDYETVFVEDGNKIVLKKILTAEDFTFTKPSELAYSGTAKEAAVTAVKGTSCETPTAKYYDAEGKELAGAPVNVGTYTVKIDVVENINCKAATDLTDNKWTFTIVPKELTVSVADVTINKGQDIPSLTVKDVTGFVDGEGADTLAGFEKPTASVIEPVNTLDTKITSFNVSCTGGNPTANYTFPKTTTAKITIKAVSIEENDYIIGKDITVWQKEDMTLLPANGYSKISGDGTKWDDSLALSTEGESSQTFYMKKADGTVTEGKTIDYKLDKTAPADVKIQYNKNGFKSFLNTITFGLFFKENVEVTAQAADASSGIADYQYYAADSEVQDVKTITGWQDSLTLTPNNKKIVYIRVTDKAGNETITNNEGVVVENIVPYISVSDGSTYCGAVEIAVSDDNLDSVTLNGKEVVLINGKFTVSPLDKVQTIVATDKAGNNTTVSITVNDGHTWDEGKVITPATVEAEGVKTYTCKHCSETRTEGIDKLEPEITQGKNSEWKQTSGGSLTFRSNAALVDFISVTVDDRMVDAKYYDLKEGSTIVTLKAEYLATLSVGKHTLSINSATGTASTEFAVASKTAEPTKPGDTSSPKTGDKTNMGLWVALLFVSIGALTSFGVSKKRRLAK